MVSYASRMATEGFWQINSPVNLVESILEKKINVSRNGPDDIPQWKKQVFKKIHENSVRAVSLAFEPWPPCLP